MGCLLVIGQTLLPAAREGARHRPVRRETLSQRLTGACAWHDGRSPSDADPFGQMFLPAGGLCPGLTVVVCRPAIPRVCHGCREAFSNDMTRLRMNRQGRPMSACSPHLQLYSCLWYAAFKR